MATVVYVLCLLASALCPVLLARGYRATRVRLLLWSALCFAGLALNNVLLFADIRIFREIDLSIVLLARGYRATRVRLLLWSALCFAGLALNNVLLFADIRIFREIALSIVRTLPALAGILLLLYGLIWETRS